MHPLYEHADSLTQEVIDAAVKVQKHFGIGALESIYVRCLERELQLAGHKTRREGVVKISYRGMDAREGVSKAIEGQDPVEYVVLNMSLCVKSSFDIIKVE